MLYHGNSFLNYDLWLNITSYLQVQDVLNASLVCRAWYRQLAHQSLWEKVYINILPGYPTDHFRTYHGVSKCSRPAFAPLDGNMPVKLNDWPKQSWKQRAVYLAYIIHVQSTVIATMRRKTNMFLAVPDRPLHDIAQINRFEQLYNTTFPIDFVIFAIYFAHHLQVNQTNRHEPSMGLVSGQCFENAHLWKYWADKFNFQSRDFDNAKSIMIEESSLLRNQPFRKMMVFPFSQLTKCDALSKAQFLGMVLSTDNIPAMVPKNEKDPKSQVDNTLTDDVSGFVWRASFAALQDIPYGLSCISESFTDYLTQYSGVVLEYGDVPHYGRIGFVDLMMRLPSENRPKTSILLPHSLDWDIGSYLPTEFTRMDSTTPVFTSFEHQIDSYDPLELDSTYSFDHAEGRSVAVAPKQLFIAAKEKYRYPTPHYRNCASKLKICNLADFGAGRYPPVETVRLPSNVYNELLEQVKEWIATSGSTLGPITRRVDDAQLQVILQTTSDLMDLYKLHQQCIPISLFYDTAQRTAIYFLWTSKEFYDHIEALQTEIIKYSPFELGVIAKRFKHQLNHLGYFIGRFENPKTDWMIRVKADLCDIPDFAWNEFHQKG